MTDSRTLKLEIAKAEEKLTAVESDLQRIKAKLDNAPRMLLTAKQQALDSERRAYDAQIRDKLKAIDAVCESIRERTVALIDSFPGADQAEFAGKYEVEALEETLSNHYPKELVEQYKCSDIIHFQSEADAFRTYTRLEKHVTLLGRYSVSGVVFSAVTRGLTLLNTAGSFGGKKVFIAIAGCMALALVAPFLPLFGLGILGTASLFSGLRARAMFRDLYSIKMFLNDSYAEDIFQDDRADILELVNSFIDKVHEEYSADITSHAFEANPYALAKVEQEFQATQETLTSQYNLKQQEKLSLEHQLRTMLEQIDALERKAEQAAKAAKDTYLGTVNWKYEWNEPILLDVTSTNKLVIFNNKKCNTLFYGDDQQALLQFETLYVFQNMIQMHPLFAAQVVLDYKLSGRGIMPFSRVNPIVFTLACDAEAVDKQLAKIGTAVRARISNILKSCENIEAFNSLMAEYGANGENYVIVHIFGLDKITPEIRDLLRNGNSVGYFFKIYLPIEEFLALGKDLPLSEFAECYEITDTATPRGRAAVERALTPAT